MEKEYKVVNGISYDKRTDLVLINLLELMRKYRIEVVITYGDPETGEDYLQEDDVRGLIGQTSGPRHSPLLVGPFNRDGMIIDTYQILRVRLSKWDKSAVVWQHPNYKKNVMKVVEAKDELKAKGYTHALIINGKLYSNHKSKDSADALKQFFQ